MFLQRIFQFILFSYQKKKFVRQFFKIQDLNFNFNINKNNNMNDQIGNKLLEQPHENNFQNNQNIPAQYQQPIQQPQYYQQPQQAQYQPVPYQNPQVIQNQQNGIIPINLTIPPYAQIGQQQQNQHPPQYGQQFAPQHVQPASNMQIPALPNNSNVHRNSVQIQCQYCGVIVFTQTQQHTGGGACIMAFLVGIFCCCCFCIPLCSDDCQDIIHICQNCGAEVGRCQYKPFG
ncbi:hypothetical protein pb186bvf_016437 [Paramecium bursaria]